MFLSSYEAMREKLLQDRTIQTMAHLGARAFPEISGEVVQTTAFVMQGQHINGFKPVFFRLVDIGQDQKESELRSGLNRFDSTIQNDFKKIPGSPVAYWVSEKVREVFEISPSMKEIGDGRQGLSTGDNLKFIRSWSEINWDHIGLNLPSRDAAKLSLKKWFPHNKGGEYRKWYGNHEFVINWFNDGEELNNFKPKSVIRNPNYYFKPAITWSDVTSSSNGFRFCPKRIHSKYNCTCCIYK